MAEPQGPAETPPTEPDRSSEPAPSSPGTSSPDTAPSPDAALPDTASSLPGSAPPSRPPTAFTRRRIALAIYALVTAVCFLTVAGDRLHAHTPANHFALQAEAWLNGRLDLGGAP